MTDLANSLGFGEWKQPNFSLAWSPYDYSLGLFLVAFIAVALALPLRVPIVRVFILVVILAEA
jgi:hypothetical protein